MITGRQIREARKLLGLTRSKLATKVRRITTTVIIRAEEVEDEPVAPPSHAIAIRQTLEALGVEFTPNGPRLHKAEP